MGSRLLLEKINGGSMFNWVFVNFDHLSHMDFNSQPAMPAIKLVGQFLFQPINPHFVDPVCTYGEMLGRKKKKSTHQDFLNYFKIRIALVTHTLHQDCIDYDPPSQVWLTIMHYQGFNKPLPSTYLGICYNETNELYWSYLTLSSSHQPSILYTFILLKISRCLQGKYSKCRAETYRPFSWMSF